MIGAVVKANILSVVNLTYGSGRKVVKASVNDGTGFMDIIWFGMPYLKKTLKVGEEYIFIGQVKKFNISNGKS